MGRGSAGDDGNDDGNDRHSTRPRFFFLFGGCALLLYLRPSAWPSSASLPAGAAAAARVAVICIDDIRAGAIPHEGGLSSHRSRRRRVRRHHPIRLLLFADDFARFQALHAVLETVRHPDLMQDGQIRLAAHPQVVHDRRCNCNSTLRFRVVFTPRTSSQVFFWLLMLSLWTTTSELRCWLTVSIDSNPGCAQTDWQPSGCVLFANSLTCTHTSFMCQAQKQQPNDVGTRTAYLTRLHAQLTARSRRYPDHGGSRLTPHHQLIRDDSSAHGQHVKTRVKVYLAIELRLLVGAASLCNAAVCTYMFTSWSISKHLNL